MYKYKNKVQLIGFVSGASIGVHENGSKYAKFNIITNESYQSIDGQKRTDKMYHLCFAFGKFCDIIDRYLETITEVAIEGSLINNSLLAEHTEVVQTSVHVSDLLLLSSRSKYQPKDY